MRICIDIDGVLCEIRQSGQSYSEVLPMPGAVEAVKELRSQGHYIILYTARHMKTTNSNVGLINARQGLITLEWLEVNCFEYDEIYFGKPWADVYIDDNAFRFSDWVETLKVISHEEH